MGEIRTAQQWKALAPWKERRTVVFMSDFGTTDGAESAMRELRQACQGI